MGPALLALFSSWMRGDYDAIALNAARLRFRKFMSTPPRLSLHVPSFRFANGRVIALPALDVNAGEIVVLRGRSGSGKSTLLHLACGVLALPRELGNAAIDGNSLAGLDQSARDRLRPRTVGWIPQRVHLLSAINVLDNTLLSFRFAGEKNGRDEEARAITLLDSLGLSALQHAMPHTLSVGQASRVSVARALVAEPKLLCADEPSASLDRESSALVAQAFARYAAGGGAMLLATHDDEFLDQLRAHQISLRTIALETP